MATIHPVVRTEQEGGLRRTARAGSQPPVTGSSASHGVAAAASMSAGFARARRSGRCGAHRGRRVLRSVRSGQTATHAVLLRNKSDRPIAVTTNGSLTAVFIDPGPERRWWLHGQPDPAARHVHRDPGRTVYIPTAHRRSQRCLGPRLLHGPRGHRAANRGHRSGGRPPSCHPTNAVQRNGPTIEFAPSANELPRRRLTEGKPEALGKCLPPPTRSF